MSEDAKRKDSIDFKFVYNSSLIGEKLLLAGGILVVSCFGVQSVAD